MSSVLVVDDESDQRELYAEYLDFSGFRTTTAASGIEALTKARADVPDLIVLDIEMPEMDGFSVARGLKADVRTQGIVIIAVTGHAEAAIADRMRAAGCDEFIAKPCLPEHLLRAVLTCLAAGARSGMPLARAGRHPFPGATTASSSPKASGSTRRRA